MRFNVNTLVFVHVNVVVVVVVGGHGEVGFGFGAAEVAGGGVIGAGGVLGGVEGAEPDAGLLAGVTDLGGVAAPWSLPDAAEVKLVGIVVWLLVLDHHVLLLLDHGDGGMKK